MTDDELLKKFKETCGKIGELFADYVIIVRNPNGGRMWRSTDPTWAVGACRRHIAGIETDDQIAAQRDACREEDSGG